MFLMSQCAGICRSKWWKTCLPLRVCVSVCVCACVCGCFCGAAFIQLFCLTSSWLRLKQMQNCLVFFSNARKKRAAKEIKAVCVIFSDGRCAKRRCIKCRVLPVRCSGVWCWRAARGEPAHCSSVRWWQPVIVARADQDSLNCCSSWRLLWMLLFEKKREKTTVLQISIVIHLFPCGFW